MNKRTIQAKKSIFFVRPKISLSRCIAVYAKWNSTNRKWIEKKITIYNKRDREINRKSERDAANSITVCADLCDPSIAKIPLYDTHWIVLYCLCVCCVCACVRMFDERIAAAVVYVENSFTQKPRTTHTHTHRHTYTTQKINVDYATMMTMRARVLLQLAQFENIDVAGCPFCDSSPFAKFLYRQYVAS